VSTPGHNKETTIGILGPGAVGGILASLFCKHNFNVICIGTRQSIKIISEKGLHLKSDIFGSFIAKPIVVTQLDKEVDILFITTKHIGLLEALKRIDEKKLKNKPIFPLLNGVEHMEILKNKFGNNIIAGAISIQVSRAEVYRIIHQSLFIRIKMAHTGNLAFNKVNNIANLLRSIGIDVEVYESEQMVLWEKLVRLNALACTTAASNKPIGYVREDPEWRKKLEGCVREAVNVANKVGLDFSFETVMNQLENLPASLTTSMQRDVNRGKMPELEAIPGAIIREGKRHNIPCPTIELIKKEIEDKLCQV